SPEEPRGARMRGTHSRCQAVVLFSQRPLLCAPGRRVLRHHPAAVVDPDPDSFLEVGTGQILNDVSDRRAWPCAIRICRTPAQNLAYDVKPDRVTSDFLQTLPSCSEPLSEAMRIHAPAVLLTRYLSPLLQKGVTDAGTVLVLLAQLSLLLTFRSVHEGQHFDKEIRALRQQPM